MLKPAEVKIVNVQIETTPKAKKVVFEVKHPEKEETVRISSVSYLVDKNVKTSGTWLNLDKENKLQKGSALATLLEKLASPTLKDAIGRTIATELDNNYLVFKAY